MGSDHNTMKPISARNSRRLAKKNNKCRPGYAWEGEVICEKHVIAEKPELSYDDIKKSLEYFEKYGVNL